MKTKWFAELIKGSLVEHTGQESKETIPISPAGHLLWKAIPPRLRVIIVLFNT